MLLSIVKKEILSQLLTFRFTFITILSILLASLCTYLNVQNYEEKLAHYNLAITEHKQEIERAEVYSNISPKVELMPEVLSILNKGVSGQFATTVTIERDRVPEVQTGSDVDNEYLAIFSTLDISNVVTIVFSLLGLLLAFSAISGEKRNGTLKLMLAGRVPRYTVLLGKYIGGVIVLAVALLIGIISGLLVMLTSDVLVLGAGEWYRIAVFILLSLVYSSAFFLLGMVISSLTRHPATSMAFSIFFWILLVVIWPRAAYNLGRLFIPVPSPKTWEERINEESQRGYDVTNVFEKLYGSYSDVGSVNQVQYTGSTGIRISGADENVIDYFTKRTEYVEPIYREAANRIWNIVEEKQNHFNRQQKLISSISLLSPAVMYETACSILSGTDAGSLDRFWRQIREYRRQVLTWFSDNNLTQSPKWFVLEGPLDLNGFPEFVSRHEILGASIIRAMLSTSLLLLANSILFLMLIYAFLIYDVR